ncbi:MAG: hypothetical protein K8T91_27185 [Planctomycetes bacterium]|nr:hypothetical protein [Planctomycetota bacterium]
MESIIRNIRDINSDDRHALEHVIGQPLRENQQIIIHVKTMSEKAIGASTSQSPSDKAAALPSWCNVYDGLSDQEIEDVEAVILDRDHWTRNPA